MHLIFNSNYKNLFRSLTYHYYFITVEFILIAGVKIIVPYFNKISSFGFSYLNNPGFELSPPPIHTPVIHRTKLDLDIRVEI